MIDKKIVDRCLKESEKISKVINVDLLNKFSEIHNINKKYSKFDIKQEVVARRSLFFNVKKRYVLHLVNEEGNECDKYFIRGIALRRSDYPSFTKFKIQELLDLILKEDPINYTKINEFVKDTEQQIIEMCKNGDKRIAKPVSFVKDEEDYKTIGNHIVGMNLWNTLEYDYFIKGTKGYLFKLDCIDQEKYYTIKGKFPELLSKKNNSIVIPYEEEKIPDYYMLDIDGCVAFAWTDRVSELLNPIEGNMRKIRKRNKSEPEMLNW